MQPKVCGSAEPPIIEVTGLTKAFGRAPAQRVALRGVDLSVAPGEWVAIVGPSGCGKSTLLHLLAGLDTADSGSVRLAGEEISALSAGRRALARRHRVGLVFQAYNLVPHLTVQANVELGMRVAGTGRRATRARAQELLDLLGLSDVARALPATLSGGQQQRVAIARAAATRPDVLLADEPTGALDSEATGTVVDLLRTENAGGRTVVMVTHDYAVAATADRIIFLRDGKVTDERRPRGLTDRPGMAGVSPTTGTSAAAGSNSGDGSEGPEPAGTDTGTGTGDVDLLGLGSW
ncbi:putative ABC transport system ATP-binding protein [Parafrankia irregularis]|uniref:Putative ABC transport system ATP-binding protein n=1 Tax=Parafrankia irregularis TaxID=795642 RepID=A0A0S4QYZ9_9ACTN|nr:MULTISPECIES: ABC transporter ATP-binding protein [Parafrankia]MBE3203469.1 ABC transporter ATP-binding protein [Parafrankia sp. CH37]CUU60172.1 putative ABC transport system ATP-binding protein [Parafrankia irregularis]